MTDKPRMTALLLLGPTGSGKTPLGEILQQRGLRGQRCLHFDFGAQLRRAVSRNSPDAQLTRHDLDFLADVLKSGALLEDEQFPIARRLLLSFLAENAPSAETILVLNGIPRHVGQARALEHLVDVGSVTVLECPSEIVLARLRANAGGDRGGRIDDDLASVRKKLVIFEERTAPLIEYYSARGASLVRIDVSPTMIASEMWTTLNP
jgi:adenylate kinase